LSTGKQILSFSVFLHVSNFYLISNYFYFCRERSTNAYDTFSYFTAKFIAELPVNVTPSFIFGIIIYWVVGLNADTFGYFLLILMMEVLTAISLGLAVSAVSPNVAVATAMGTPLVVIALMFGGYFSKNYLISCLCHMLMELNFSLRI
jgi:ABC-type multidrug transport system permease subunit